MPASRAASSSRVLLWVLVAGVAATRAARLARPFRDEDRLAARGRVKVLTVAQPVADVAVAEPPDELREPQESLRGQNDSGDREQVDSGDREQGDLGGRVSPSDAPAKREHGLPRGAGEAHATRGLSDGTRESEPTADVFAKFQRLSEHWSRITATASRPRASDLGTPAAPVALEPPRLRASDETAENAAIYAAILGLRSVLPRAWGQLCGARGSTPRSLLGLWVGAVRRKLTFEVSRKRVVEYLQGYVQEQRALGCAVAAMA
mmetsp:Transcript_37876/g.108902  ORF Transcript_37876/g.108902 Transcript_37876/m.108902 type:complete len:263 (-) Transcript_37876:61-849(-)